jgi:ABC-type antimicrobial peptide transport system permease subunit
MKLTTGVGRFENVVMDSPFQVWDYGDGPYYTNHLMISSSDPAATEAYLTEKLGADGFMSPDDVLDQLAAEFRSGAIVIVVTVTSVVALMCLCVFFIMRSSFMSRVREVGILRAIGVTKKNLTFRFAVETALLLLLTIVPGYGLSFWFIGSLNGAPLLSEMFYFPVWLGVGLFIILAAVTLIFGVLPAITLLRKTPSEILSKYDI